MEFTEEEKIILSTMFMNMDNIVKSGDYYINNECFTSNDLFDLAVKLGIENYY